MDAEQIFEILSRVRTWDVKMRINLARQILETVVPPQPSHPSQTMTLEEIQVIMKTDKRPPTDEECKKILEEERLKKYRLVKGCTGEIN